MMNGQMIIHIEDKPHLIWLPNIEVTDFIDDSVYTKQIVSGDETTGVGNLTDFLATQEYRTGDTCKADCPECKASGQGKPMAGYENSFGIGSRPQGDCQHCNQGQIEYRIAKVELIRQGKINFHECGKLIKAGLIKDVEKLDNYLLISELNEAKNK